MPKLISIPEELQGVIRFNDVTISDVEPVNELFSKCVVKILYTGLNRNGVYISKEVADEMAKTLYNIPIVGEYIETIEDFKDHGGRIEITTDDVKFIQTTKPYGFVPEDTVISWQKIKEADGTTRDYLTCVGYLWTGRYPEAQKVIAEGRPQSMELDEDSLEGYWKQEGQNTIFHIEKAQFSALCILGSDVPPAFESADIGSYYVANPISFSKRFSRLLRDYEESNVQRVANFSANNKKEETNEGGQEMFKFNLDLDKNTPRYQIYSQLNPVKEDDVRNWSYSIADIQDNYFLYVDEHTGQAYKRQYAWEDNSLKYEGDAEEVKLVEYTEENDNAKTELEELQEKYSSLEANYNELKEQSVDADAIIALKKENEALKEFKAEVENKEKQSVIDKFKAILKEDDIKPFEEKITEFSKEQLEEKLSVIALRKVDFTQENPTINLIPDNDKNKDNLSGVEKLIRKHSG